MRRIVGVHGIAQQYSGRAQLLNTWTAAMSDGVELAAGRDSLPTDLDVAYYGDLFLAAGSHGVRVDQNGRPWKGTSTEPLADLPVEIDELLFLELASSEIEDRTEDLGVPKVALPAVPKILQPLLYRLVRRFDASVALGLISTLRQVYRYQRDSIVATEIRKRVEDAITRGCQVLIGHSLGSVIAFETLVMNPRLEVDTLITLGSPLGLKVVRERLRPSDGPRNLRQCAALNRWVNIYDPADPVSGCGGAGIDLGPSKEYQVDNGSRPHAVERYLSRRITGEVILDAGTAAA